MCASMTIRPKTENELAAPSFNRSITPACWHKAAHTTVRARERTACRGTTVTRAGAGRTSLRCRLVYPLQVYSLAVYYKAI